MSTNETGLVASIDLALQKVTDLFLHQCAHGAQTKNLPDGYAACGQFIGNGAAGISQRGLHGIAAALRVLGPSSTEPARQAVAQLVAYCEECFGLHPGSTLPQQALIDDTDNVIKLGELLYGLSFVTASQADVGRLVRHIAGLLQTSLVDDRGWGYFLNDKTVQLLPTAYATRGLAQNNFDVTKPRRFIVESLRTRTHPTNESPADLTSAVACAYCLTFVRSTDQDRATIVETFDAAWRLLEPLLGEDVEQNLEYWSPGKTHYVRVPWQLYLLALAAELRFWHFASFRAQRRLKAVIKQLQSASFKYPFSGQNLSSRTNAIAFDVLGEIRTRIRKLAFVWLAYQFDRVRMVIGSRPVRSTAAAIACVLILYSTLRWREAGKVSDLAPSFIASLVSLVLTTARR